MSRRAALDVTWHAAADRVAHAFPVRAVGRLRALCGREPWAERYDWPPERRCADCRLALEGEAPIALPL